MPVHHINLSCSPPVQPQQHLSKKGFSLSSLAYDLHNDSRNGFGVNATAQTETEKGSSSFDSCSSSLSALALSQKKNISVQNGYVKGGICSAEKFSNDQEKFMSLSNLANSQCRNGHRPDVTSKTNGFSLFHAVNSNSCLPVQTQLYALTEDDDIIDNGHLASHKNGIARTTKLENSADPDGFGKRLLLGNDPAFELDSFHLLSLKDQSQSALSDLPKKNSSGMRRGRAFTGSPVTGQPSYNKSLRADDKLSYNRDCSSFCSEKLVYSVIAGAASPSRLGKTLARVSGPQTTEQRNVSLLFTENCNSLIVPFDFASPSPDDIVTQKQRAAFSNNIKRTSTTDQNTNKIQLKLS